MNPPKIVTLGDSLTEGYDINLDYAWPNLLRQELNIEIINSGISGDTTAGMLARFQSMVLDHHPSHLIIMGGTNDLSMNLSDEQILSNILAMTRQARYRQIKVILGIPTPFIYPELPSEKSHHLPSDSFSERIKVYQEKLKKFAIDDGHPFIDFSTIAAPEFFLEDGVHPNEKGQSLMKDKAAQVLKTILVI